jgi:copper transport protein
MDIFWRWLHLVAAGFWLGGLIMLAIVTMSAIRVMERSAFRQLIRRVGRAFLLGSIIAWALLAVSGVGMAVTRIHSIDALTGTGYGRTLLGKVVLFALAIIGTVVHTLAGGRASPMAIRLSRTLSQVIVLLTLAIVYLAVRLTEG